MNPTCMKCVPRKTLSQVVKWGQMVLHLALVAQKNGYAKKRRYVQEICP